MRKSQTLDLTAGKPIKQILLFSIPLVLGMFFQQFYTFVDTAMVGRLVGDDALAAVGASSGIYFMVLGFVQGICIGFGIPLAQAVGARDPREFKRYFWNGTWLTIFFGILCTAGTIFLTDPLLTLVNTPADIFREAAAYIRIIFWGIPATMLYNFCATILRSSGDSQRPTYFLIATCILNIILDYVLIVPIPLGVAGAALATILSQLVSGLLNLGWIVFRTDLLKASSGLKTFSGSHARRLCAVGLPMGFEYAISAMGNVIMQSAINSFGTAVIAGQVTGEKIRMMFTLPMESVGSGIATFAGQNSGANRYDRVKQGIFAGLAIQLTYCIFAWMAIFFGKGAFTELVMGTQASEAAILSIRYLGLISTLFCFHGSLMVMRNTLQGMGYSAHAVLSGVGELAGRGICAWAATATMSFTWIILSSPLAWTFALSYCTCMVAWFLKKHKA